MVDVGTLAIVLVAAVASMFMAWAIGAGSSGSTPFAPAVGANAISVMRAGFLVGVFCFLGAVLQGASISETMGRDLIDGVALTPESAAVALLTAAALVAFGVFTGYPIPTAFTATGAVIGAGLAIGGDPAWGTYRGIGALWVLTPFVGGPIAYATARLLRHERVAERFSVPTLAGVVGALIANIEFVLLGPPDETASISEELAAGLVDAGLLGAAVGRVLMTVLIATACTAVVYREMRHDPHRGQHRFLLVMGALVAFSAGGSQVGLAVGPMVPLLEDFGVSIVAILLGGGIGLLVGSWTGAPRMIKAIAQDYSSLGPRRSIAALIPSFAIAQAAILFGIPVSFNEIVVSAVVGAGYVAGGSGGVSRSKMGYTVLAWVGSLALSIVLAYAVLTAVQWVL
jgi:PiT family inorganic phosphate transporter